ncbi:MAG: 4-hydroxythreonine-4-phosphate dehydrogenase PdxA [Candidatus Omnitrophica bacterium]|nr:4-hydroxythreonine-4-phosphate dehydrogenase PdxA [Candidatus Omnitrophota bacterium]
MKKPKKKIIGITLGDPGGIGPEVVAKALQNPAIRRLAHFKIIGDEIIFKKFRFPQTPMCQLINSNKIHPFDFAFKDARCAGAASSLAYLETAVGLFKENKLDGLVTGPVSKEAISALGVPFSGHTEFLADNFGITNFEMMFHAPDLKLIIATRHLPLKDIPEMISQTQILRTLRLANQSLKKLFNIKKPRIALAGLNPHAGEGGMLGQEEQSVIIPAINDAKEEGICAFGPFAADTMFSKKNFKKYDLFIAMYHDQGLAPLKALYFNQLVNVTLGLPFIRTSPSHGTAFDIAGKNKADPSSMIEAIKFCARYT